MKPDRGLGLALRYTAAILVTVIFLFPIYWLFAISFKTPEEIFGKVMRVPDEAMPVYYELLMDEPFDPGRPAVESKRHLARNRSHRLPDVDARYFLDEPEVQHLREVVAEPDSPEMDVRRLDVAMD